MSKPLSARKVRHARKVITKDQCPETMIRHRWMPLNGLFVKCVRCGAVV